MFKKAGNTLIDAIFYQKEDNQTPKESSIITLCNAKSKMQKSSLTIQSLHVLIAEGTLLLYNRGQQIDSSISTLHVVQFGIQYTAGFDI